MEFLISFLISFVIAFFVVSLLLSGERISRGSYRDLLSYGLTVLLLGAILFLAITR